MTERRQEELWLKRSPLKTLMSEKLKEPKSVVLQRKPAARAQRGHVDLLTDHVTAFLKTQLDEMTPASARAERLDRATSTERDFAGFESRARLNDHLVERVTGDLSQPMHVLSYTVPLGNQVLGPPYDVEWQAGGGLAFGGRLDGKAITISSPGFSAAAIGFFLSSTEPALAAITPMGTYDWSWFSAKTSPALRSRGGLAVTTYVVSENPPPERTLWAQLWSVNGVAQWSGSKGGGALADVSSPSSGPFGPMRIFPVFANLGPGVQYLIWVWCWQITDGETPDDAFLAFLRMKMDFVAVNAGPPIVIR
jgi:hypothetical protein